MTDTTTPTGRDLVHAEHCPGPRLVERESARKRLTICQGCGAMVTAPRVTRWTEQEGTR